MGGPEWLNQLAYGLMQQARCRYVVIIRYNGREVKVGAKNMAHAMRIVDTMLSMLRSRYKDVSYEIKDLYG